MTFVVNTDADRAEMLAAIGVQRIEDLFLDVPAAHRFPRLDLPPALTEAEVLADLRAMADRNADLEGNVSFLGAGAYHHFIPAVVDFVISRSEFYTSYTPYQPEVSQGTLQALFEYQTMIATLSGMEVSNASHYDGATSTAEGVNMALHLTRHKRTRIVMAPTVHPQYRAVVHTYLQGYDLEFVGEDLPPFDYLDALTELIDDNTACVVVQNPDFLGAIQSPARLQELADAVHAHKALFLVVANPISLGLLTPPGEYGADIYAGEGQATGNALSFGGPYLGLFACRMAHVRKSAGRIVGETVDVEGRRGFVLTLVAREQFIRREKASSNICTNQNLNALACAVYLTALGKQGLRQVAQSCTDNAHYLASRIQELPGYEVLNPGHFFHEFAVRCPEPVSAINDHLLHEKQIVGGYDLGQDYPELGDNVMLLCTTELNTPEQMDRLVDGLRERSEAHGA